MTETDEIKEEELDSSVKVIKKMGNK